MSELRDAVLSYLASIDRLKKAEGECEYDRGYFLSGDYEAVDRAEERFVSELAKRLGPQKREEWKQANPADQLVQIVSGIQGYASNLTEGVYSVEKAKEVGEKISDWSSQLIELVKMLPPTTWPRE